MPWNYISIVYCESKVFLSLRHCVSCFMDSHAYWQRNSRVVRRRIWEVRNSASLFNILFSGLLARQQIVGEPAAEYGLGRVVEDCDRKVTENNAAMPATRAADPIVIVERVPTNTDLLGQTADPGGRQIGFIVGKAAVLPPIGKLCGQAEFADVRQVDEQSQVLGHERPALVNLVPRPLPLHRPPPSARSRRLRIASRTHHPSMAILHSFAVTGPLYGLPPITARSRRAFDRFAHIQYLTILLSTPGLRFQFWYQNWKRNRQPVGGGERRKAAFSAGPTLISSKALSRGQPTTG